jgi:mycofactocin precursor
MLAEVRMPEVSTPVVGGTVVSSTGRDAETDALTSGELLVEEVSIDGMCGVY